MSVVTAGDLRGKPIVLLGLLETFYAMCRWARFLSAGSVTKKKMHRALRNPLGHLHQSSDHSHHIVDCCCMTALLPWQTRCKAPGMQVLNQLYLENCLCDQAYVVSEQMDTPRNFLCSFDHDKCKQRSLYDLSLTRLRVTLTTISIATCLMS